MGKEDGLKWEIEPDGTGARAPHTRDGRPIVIWLVVDPTSEHFAEYVMARKSAEGPGFVEDDSFLDVEFFLRLEDAMAAAEKWNAG